MDHTLHFLIIILFLDNVCYQRDLTFTAGGNGRINNNNIQSGFIEICDNNEYIPICRDGASNISLRYICARSGYYGQLL